MEAVAAANPLSCTLKLALEVTKYTGHEKNSRYLWSKASNHTLQDITKVWYVP